MKVVAVVVEKPAIDVLWDICGGFGSWRRNGRTKALWSLYEEIKRDGKEWELEECLSSEFPDGATLDEIEDFVWKTQIAPYADRRKDG